MTHAHLSRAMTHAYPAPAMTLAHPAPAMIHAHPAPAMTHAHPSRAMTHAHLTPAMTHAHPPQRSRGGDNAAVAQRLRLGHVPAGSTDAVAYSLHGTRNAETATLHIAMGCGAGEGGGQEGPGLHGFMITT